MPDHAAAIKKWPQVILRFRKTFKFDKDIHMYVMGVCVCGAQGNLRVCGVQGNGCVCVCVVLRVM